ncbi:MAG: inactive serine/threonine-protein kinase VRK3, partial [Myxococcota bacterium]
MLCYRCGSYNADDARQCSECGAALGERRKSSGKSKRRRPPGQAPFEPGQRLGERYRVADAIGLGTVGWVLRARDEQTNRDVAVKVINPNLLQTDSERSTFSKTLRQARKVDHPNVTPVYDEGREGRYTFYTMPYLEGLTLRKIIDLRIEKQQTFALSEVLPLTAQLTQAADAWGRFGYHGAIRPNSVVVLPDVLKVTALAHHQGLPRKPFVVFQEQARASEYLAPEARQADGPVDVRADLYSIAVIFAEMLTGVVYGRNEETWKKAESALAAPLVEVLGIALAE